MPSQLLLQLLHSHLCVPTRYSFDFTLGEDRRHSMHCPEIGRSDTQVGRPRQRMIFVQMAGLLAMPTLLPEGVLSAEGEDAQAVNSS